MELELKIFDCLCATEKFTVNGVDADSDDFGNQNDNQVDAEEYCCGNMLFTPNLAIDSVLEKYNISANEYTEIAEKLEEGLSFGCCGWCS